VALFELVPAATGAWIVATSLSEATLQFLLFLRQKVHDIGW
jgi:hypothetical protein